jgi:hypothetical protein
MTPSTPPRRVLVLTWVEPFRPVRPAIRQHLRLFESSPAGHHVYYLNVALGVPAWIRRARFDVVVLHTTLLCTRWFAQAEDVRRTFAWLADSPAFKVALPQDEYDHAAVLDDWVADLGIDLVGSNFGPEHRPTLYPRSASRARFVQVLTGYLDLRTAESVIRKLKPAAERPLDLVYRATKLPFGFGRHGQLKHQIGTAAAQAAVRLGLSADISVDPRAVIQSDRWYDFLASGRAIVGCESGSSALDRRGELHAAVRQLLAEQPDMTFDEVSARLPVGWDDHHFFAVGPRHLEAIMTRTCQVLVEGDYDGLLTAGVHYVPVRRDLANLDEALLITRDPKAVDRMTQRAFDDLFLAGKLTYASAAVKLDEAMTDAPARPRSPFAELVMSTRLGLSQLIRQAMRAVRGAWRRALRPVGATSRAAPTQQPEGAAR